MTDTPDPTDATLVVRPWDSMTGWNAAMMTAVDGVQASAAAFAAWQQETAQFLERRIAGNQRAWAAVSASRDVAGAIAAQQDWAREAASDYSGEATRLTRLFTTLCLTGTTPAVQRAATLLG